MHKDYFSTFNSHPFWTIFDEVMALQVGGSETGFFHFFGFFLGLSVCPFCCQLQKKPGVFFTTRHRKSQSSQSSQSFN